MEAARVMLVQENKPICLTRCRDDIPFKIPSTCSIATYKHRSSFEWHSLPHFRLFPDPQNDHQKREWGHFLSYLGRSEMAAEANTDYCRFYIFAPAKYLEFTHCIVHFVMRNPDSASDYHKNGGRAAVHRHHIYSTRSHSSYQEFSRSQRDMQNKPTLTRLSPASICYLEERDVSSRNNTGDCTPGNACKSLNVEHTVDKELISGTNGNDMKMCGGATQPASNKVIPIDSATYDSAYVMQSNFLLKNFVKTDPSYLATLGQTHSAWIFGAIAELIDNSRDAHATRLDIFVELLYSKKDGKEIPVLSIIDDGDGMTHNEILRMLSIGHNKTNGEDQDRIGRFGIGFKTGAMKLGRDALVLTQSSRSRSFGFLSQSYNENKDNIEIPIVSYSKNGRYMELDLSAQSEELANLNLSAIKKFSPFNEYLLGEQVGLFGKDRTGTQVFIWNLDKWGSDYTLEWVGGKSGDEVQGDILIRSRRIRSRIGQLSREVPLDYSLQAYLEVIFLNPRMKIFIQDSLVKSHPLEKSLSKTVALNGSIMARPIQLILGRSQVEYERMNSGVFLYWNGRLIEAYKRVGGMQFNGDVGRGVIGVADVTDIMHNGKGQVWVLNNKQGFQDCEAYAKLEDWMGNKANGYWDENFDNLNLVTNGEQYEPDHKWVQCDKCRKWRMLTDGFNIESLSSSEWFCYMPPFNGSCQAPEQKMKEGVVTVAATRCQQPDPVQSSVFPEERAESVLASHANDSPTKVTEVKCDESGLKERRPTQMPERFGELNPPISTTDLKPKQRWNCKRENNIKSSWPGGSKESGSDLKVKGTPQKRAHCFHDVPSWSKKGLRDYRR